VLGIQRNVTPAKKIVDCRVVAAFHVRKIEKLADEKAVEEQNAVRQERNQKYRDKRL